MQQASLDHGTRSTRLLGRRSRVGAAILVCLAGVAVGAEARVTPAAEPASPIAAPPGPLTSDWVENCMAVIRRLYQFMGGDPHYLDGMPTLAAMGATTSYYDANGCPDNLTEEQKAAGRADVEAAYAATTPMAPGGGPPVIQFRLMLKSLYADLGGNPDTL
jgi:hypothetical protein